MQPKIQEQILDLINKSQNILLAISAHPSGDSLASSLGLGLFLKNNGKHVDLCSENSVVASLDFLPGANTIRQHADIHKNFIISVSTVKTKVDEISYNVEDNRIDINLKPKSGELNADDVTFNTDISAYQLIITIGLQSLEQLGDFYAKNTELFFTAPKINIDNRVDNENFGTVNAVDLTVASNAETIYDLCKNLDSGAIDADAATALLAGIILETNSFQQAKTTPNSFLTASELIARGGRQQEIIQHTFKRKELSTLKLWGRAMARIKILQQPGLFYTILNAQDIQRSEASEADVHGVIKEMIASIPDIKILFVAYEHGSSTKVLVYISPNMKLSEIVNHFGGKIISDTTGSFELQGVALNSAEKIIEQALIDLKPRLGL